MMSFFIDEYDVAVIGAGHAGCEAALAAARLGAKTIIFSINCSKGVSSLFSTKQKSPGLASKRKSSLTVMLLCSKSSNRFLEKLLISSFFLCKG